MEGSDIPPPANDNASAGQAANDNAQLGVEAAEREPPMSAEATATVEAPSDAGSEAVNDNAATDTAERQDVANDNVSPMADLEDPASDPGAEGKQPPGADT